MINSKPMKFRLSCFLVIGLAVVGVTLAEDQNKKEKKRAKKNADIILLEGKASLDFKVNVEGDFAYERARAYPLLSQDVLSSFQELADERKMAFARTDLERGIFVTNWLRIDKKRFPGLESPDGVFPDRVRYHILIPQGIQPARVYINSELEARQRGGPRMMFYNAGGMENWLFTELESRLGERGRVLPQDPAVRTELFEALLSGSTSGCAQEQVLLSGIGNISNPRLLKEFKAEPIYPRGTKERNATIILKGIVYEDGSVSDPVVVNSNVKDRAFDTMSKYTVSFWRYDPAFRGDCPVAVHWTVVVDYTRR